ncbi:septum site-determining protein MinC [Roseomonas sp. GC11]|uniref:septum site-determining protein MinC n=1 Tax=Roseomonas sp. GC11 TaxID=2950546 RepID=UPI00210E5847|nr:septum site-determining protein MinC [Roseomonas sp. GC11]MCQ4159962.1 septum site-determining protein MinC [Roseomonas sp. GC11]
MTQDSTRAAAAHSPIRLRGRAHPFLTLDIADLEPEALEQALASRLAGTASFFRHAPVLLDLGALPADAGPRVAGLVEAVRRMGLVPAAFRARWPEVERAALAAGLGRMLEPEPRQDLAAPCDRRPTVIVSEPVRSGQRIYAAEADLVVLHSVSPGAQLLADGCIHVYGALRGSASAGIGDDPHARIFAKIMDAEMLSIAGLWLSAEEVPSEWVKRPAQLAIRDGWLRFSPLP